MPESKNPFFLLETAKLAIIGLGYVGLPLAVEFGKRRPVVGFDIDTKRIDALRGGHDSTLEVSDEELAEAVNLKLSSSLADLEECNVFIVTVPTPIDVNKRPDLKPLKFASETLGEVLKPGDVVIYESTVYPGATEEECVPVLESVSGLSFNLDFFAGYSPERINPGDKTRGLTSIVKVTSGSTPEVADFVDELYASIVTAGTHKAPSIRVAEAAKVIENTQRDINIALMNELSVIFSRLNIETKAVLEAANTKWNFLNFTPGLVGGHCIGIDPYYLAHKAQSVSCHPDLILSARRINDGMSNYVANKIIYLMGERGLLAHDAAVLILGYTFKENCPDTRNTKIQDLEEALLGFGIRVDVFDPVAGIARGLDGQLGPAQNSYDAVVLAVPHEKFLQRGIEWVTSLGRDGSVIADLKGVLDTDRIDFSL